MYAIIHKDHQVQNHFLYLVDTAIIDGKVGCVGVNNIKPFVTMQYECILHRCSSHAKSMDRCLENETRQVRY